MAQRDRCRMKPSPVHRISAETAQLDNALRPTPQPGIGAAEHDAMRRFLQIDYLIKDLYSRFLHSCD